MLWVVTLSVFLPLLISSSVVWVNPSPGHKPSKVASNQIFFMITLLCTSSMHWCLEIAIMALADPRCAPLYTAPPSTSRIVSRRTAPAPRPSISRIDAGCEALAEGGVVPRDVRAPRPESSAAHLADWNDLAQ